MKKILHIFSSFELGGAQARFLKLVASHGNQFEHIVFAADGCYDAKNKNPHLPIQTLHEYSVAKGFLSSNYGVAKQMIRAVQPHLVVSYNWGAVEWVVYSALLGLHHIHVEDGFGAAEVHKRKLRRSMFRALIFRLCNAKLVVISETLESIARDEWYVQSGKLVYVPNGVTVNSNPTAPTHTDLATGRTIIGTVCGLRPEKRVDRLIDAVAALAIEFPKLDLWIIGDGHERQNLETLVEERNLKTRIRFFGHLNEPNQLMSEFDLFCLTSDTEQAPLSLLEAMALGLPCIATRVGDVPNIIAVENRPFLCNLSVQSVANSIRAALLEPQNLLLVGAANKKKYLERYQFDQSSQQWMRIFLSQCKP